MWTKHRTVCYTIIKNRDLFKPWECYVFRLYVNPVECDSKCFFSSLFSGYTFEQIWQMCFFVNIPWTEYLCLSIWKSTFLAFHRHQINQIKVNIEWRTFSNRFRTCTLCCSHRYYTECRKGNELLIFRKCI